MPIRNRIKPEGLKLVIPERKISPRDWSLPYQRRGGFRWSFGCQERSFVQQQKVTSTTTRTTATNSSRMFSFTCQRRRYLQVQQQQQQSYHCGRGAAAAGGSRFLLRHRQSTGLSSGDATTSADDVFSSSNVRHVRHHHHVQHQQQQQQHQHVLTPTDLIDDPISALEAGRRSSGALMSPDVLLDTTPVSGGISKGSPSLLLDGDVSSSSAGILGEVGTGDNFYLLKKDSQRRLTLVRVLQADRAEICRQWRALLLRDINETCLTESHLGMLLDGVRDYIPEQNVSPLESAISELKEALDYDGANINHINMALYVFQDAVNSTLRSHSIKPHWMFALDNLVRSAVQAAITILSPELGPHLANPTPGAEDGDHGGGEHNPDGDGLAVGEAAVGIEHQPNDQDGASTSGVSTVNSAHGAVGAAGGGENAQVHHHNHSHHGPAVPSQAVHGQLQQLREENGRLLSQLLDLQRGYQNLLRHNLDEQRLHLQALRQHMGQAGQLRSIWSPPILGSRGLSAEDNNNAAAATPDADNNVNNNNSSSSDDQLVDWLRGLSLSQDTIQRFVDEDLSYTDVSSLMSREDLRRLGLRAGPEIRVWRAILDLRGHQEQGRNRIDQDEEPQEGHKDD